MPFDEEQDKATRTSYEQSDSTAQDAAEGSLYVTIDGEDWAETDTINY